MTWWATQPEAWAEVNVDAEAPEVVMKDFCKWVEDLQKQAIFVASPTAFDYGFVGWYLEKLVGKNPFCDPITGNMRTLDLRSFIAGKYGLSFDNSTRTKLPASLTEGMAEHTHRAIDDAAGYGFLLRTVLAQPALEA